MDEVDPRRSAIALRYEEGTYAPKVVAKGRGVLAEAIIGGDAKVKSISAASILAKVHRDRLCQALDQEFPHYGFAAHKGYGTPEHLQALRQHGACRHHRRFFGPVAATFTTPGGEVITLRTA